MRFSNKRLWCTLLTVAGALLSTTLQASPAQPTHTYTLDNGLRVIVREDHRAPVATVQMWYKVGSVFEHNGITGLSHLLEHMMFKGTPKNPEGALADIITKHGGVLNAFTSYDMTAYYASLPSSQVETVIALEADRMRNTNFSQEAFSKELQVVIEERRLRTDDQPTSLGLERFLAQTFTSSPYRNPVIGWPSDLNQATRQAALDWYNTWYHPNQAILIVVGDVHPKKVRRWAKNYLEDLPEGASPNIHVTQEVAPLGAKHMDLSLRVALPMLYLALPAPLYTRESEAQTDAAAFALLMQILDGGLSARFETHLVRDQQLAASIGTDYSPFSRFQNLLFIQATATPGTSLPQLQAAIWQEMLTLTQMPVDDATLARAKMQFKAQDVFARDSLEGQAMEIGTLEVIGLTWEDKDRFLTLIEHLSAADLQRVAQRYFNQQGLSTAYLHPDTTGTTGETL